MKKITIGFSRPKCCVRFPIFSWAIRALYRTPYSHVYVRWQGNRVQSDIVYEASGTAVKFLAGHIFDEKAIVTDLYETEISLDAYFKLLTFCMNNAGVSYGMWQAIGIGLKDIFKLKNNPFPNGIEKQVCSELVSNIMEDILDVNVDKPKDLINPPDIKKILDEHTEIFKKVK